MVRVNPYPNNNPNQGGIPSPRLKAKPGLFRLAGLISARVAFHERDLSESPLSNHGNLSDQPNLVGSRLTVRLTRAVSQRSPSVGNK